ncbi:MAG: tRNA uridine-5-carboxymethylaminomethyl(34) synthesis GTPase MnmE [Hyphomicrobiales bacterium]
MEDTICALSSGAGVAGVALIRISGSRCRSLLNVCVGNVPVSRKAALVSIVHPYTEELIDKGLALFFPGPHSFTGEDVAELHVHGGRAVVETMLDALCAFDGVRLAEPGEFTRRAFENGKLDLTQTEGLADLIAANTDAQRKQALRVSSGEARIIYERWRETLIACLAYYEADIDFVDEDDVPEDVRLQVRDRISVLTREISGHLDDPRKGEKLRDGFRVVIAGVPNVGKSSLLNRLVRREAAIVSDIEGTTRDVVEVYLDLDGLPVVISDTAGLREGGGKIEEIGIERAKSVLRDADLIVWLADERGIWPSSVETSIDSDALWVVNKADLIENQRFESVSRETFLHISAKNDYGIDDLLAKISNKARDVLVGGDSVVISRRRHRQSLQSCKSYLLSAEKAEREAVDIELIAEDLRLAARELGRVIGRVDVEDLLDVIFSDFCIGK